jgi:hypothetical protein
MKYEFSQQIFEKYSKCNENPSNGSRAFHADRRMDIQTDMTELTVGFRNFVKAPKNTTRIQEKFPSVLAYRLCILQTLYMYTYILNEFECKGEIPSLSYF